MALPEMQLLDGLHHVTFLTEDVERLVGFYGRVFGATKTLDMVEEGIRHVFLDVGSRTVLHPFQLLDERTLPATPGTMFERGRVDHFALLAPTEQAFRELRGRIEQEGAADGAVRDMGNAWIMGFHDPDGLYVEVIWRKPGVPDARSLRREKWTTVEMSASH